MRYSHINIPSVELHYCEKVIHLLQLYGGDTAYYLYDQYHRGILPVGKERDENSRRLR